MAVFLTEWRVSVDSLQAAEPPCSVSNGPHIYKYWKPHQMEDRLTKQTAEFYWKKWSKNWRSEYAPTWDCHKSRQPSPCTVAAMEDSTWFIWRSRARHPLRHNTELRRSSKLIFVRMKLPYPFSEIVLAWLSKQTVPRHQYRQTLACWRCCVLRLWFSVRISTFSDFPVVCKHL